MTSLGIMYAHARKRNCICFSFEVVNITTKSNGAVVLWHVIMLWCPNGILWHSNDTCITDCKVYCHFGHFYGATYVCVAVLNCVFKSVIDIFDIRENYVKIKFLNDMTVVKLSLSHIVRGFNVWNCKCYISRFFREI